MATFQVAAGQTYRSDHFFGGRSPDQLFADLTPVVNGDGSVQFRLIERYSNPQNVYATFTSDGSILQLPNGQPIYPIDEGRYQLGDINGDFDLYDHTSGVPVFIGTLSSAVLRDVTLFEIPIYGAGGVLLGYSYELQTAGPFPFFIGDLTAAFGDGNDVFEFFGGGDLVADLGRGNDTVYLFEEGFNAPYHHVVQLGSGADSLFYQSGNGEIYGGGGPDTIGGNGNTDGVWFIDGGTGRDTVLAYGNSPLGFSTVSDGVGSGDDTYSAIGDVLLSYATGSGGINVDLDQGFQQSAGHGTDTLSGFNRIDGSQGNDVILGGSAAAAGAYTFRGLGGNDTLTGGVADDALNGGSGDDTLDGAEGDDVLLGGAGTDVLTGDTGRDLMNGGTGPDTFVYLDRSDSTVVIAGRDRISGYSPTEDLIDLSLIDARPKLAGDQAFTFIGEAAFTSLGQVRYEHVGTTTTIVYINIEGPQNAEMRIDIAGIHTLTDTSFIL